jgi:putative ABC transport system substrate-binding protein
MTRRDFITLLGGAAAAAWPVAARGQQSERMRRVAILFGGFADDDPEPLARMAALRQGLQQLGWADGINLRIEYRTGGGDPDRVRAHASDLTTLAPDVIVANSAPALAAVQKVARATPIIFVSVADPVASGFIASLAHPGGNITGFTNFEQSMGAKWLELLKEIAPGISRVAVFQDAASPAAAGFRRVMEAAAPSFHVQLTFIFAHEPAEIERIIVEFSREAGGGIVFPGGTIISGNRKLLTQLTARHGLPAIYAFAYFPRMDGLMSYGVDGIDLWRRAAPYVDRILRGAKPGDLPVQQPTKFELVINLKTAKTLGLTVPPTLLARADEVIE